MYAANTQNRHIVSKQFYHFRCQSFHSIKIIVNANHMIHKNMMTILDSPINI